MPGSPLLGAVLRPVALAMCAMTLAACSRGEIATGVGMSNSAHLNAPIRYYQSSPRPPRYRARRTVRKHSRFQPRRYEPVAYKPASPLPANYKLGAPYTVRGLTYVPRHEPGYDKAGIASWYGGDFQGRQTANGEIFDKNRLTAAHPTLPLPSLVRVTNLDNGRRIVVRVNDRGPFVKGRLIDLTRRGADELGYTRNGQAPVRVEFLGLAQ